MSALADPVADLEPRAARACKGYGSQPDCDATADTPTRIWCQRCDAERFRDLSDAVRPPFKPDPADLCRRCHREAPCAACAERGAYTP